jgi:hypothetical protein
MPLDARMILGLMFASLAMLAMGAVWRVEGARSVGIAGFATWGINNIAMYAWLGGYIDFDARVEMLVLSECSLASIAFLAHTTGGSRLLTVVVGAAMFAVGADLVIAKDAMLYGLPPLGTRHQWNFATNVCFVLERLAIIGIGTLTYARNRDLRRSHSLPRLLAPRDADAWFEG